jgi:NAD+ kinase
MRVAIYSGSFNPPALHHQRIVRELAERFDRVLVVPSGVRPDKPSTDRVGRLYRATMADLAFSGIEKVTVELFDLEQPSFTRTHELQKRFEHLGEIWHVVGTNLIEGGRRGDSVIHRVWSDAGAVWREMNFAVVSRHGGGFTTDDLPPKHELLDLDLEGSSAEIRARLFRGESVESLLAPDVHAYIERHQLYHGSVPLSVTSWQIDEPRLLIVADERNPKACEWKERLRRFACHERPNLIVVIGGDGTMLHAIQEHWRKRLPFFGLNAGHLGFLMNDESSVSEDDFPPSPLILRQMPMIHAESQLETGDVRHDLSFNDVWVERVTGQTAWFSLAINGETRFSKMVSDGVLLSTAAGSTAYALSMGATPLLADTAAWLVVGNNVMQPRSWKSAMLSLDDTVEITVLDHEKRPVQGYIYGVPIGEVLRMRASISRVASAELAFCQDHDMAHKIARLQFPPDESCNRF